MKEDKKLNSIANLTEEEMINTRGGAMSYALVDAFPYGIPVEQFLSQIKTFDKNVLVLKTPVVTRF